MPDRRLSHDHIYPDAARLGRAGSGQLGCGRVRGQLCVPGTRQASATQLRLWFDWCEKHHLEPLADVRRPHVELYARGLEARGLAAATVALKLVVLYRYCVEEQLLEHSPAVHVSRPKVSEESTRLGLDRAASRLVGTDVRLSLTFVLSSIWAAPRPSASLKPRFGHGLDASGAKPARCGRHPTRWTTPFSLFRRHFGASGGTGRYPRQRDQNPARLPVPPRSRGAGIYR
jgi:hypothetical protein